MLRYSKICVTALALAIISAPAGAQSQAEQYVARELPYIVEGVDVASLSPAQISAIYLILTDARSEAEARREVRSVLFGFGRLFSGQRRLFP